MDAFIFVCQVTAFMSRLKAGICTSLTEVILNKLHENGIYSVTDFIAQDVENLAQRINVSYKDIGAIRKVLLAKFASVPILASEAYNEITRSVSILSTGSDRLDNALDGGVYTTEVCEVVGDLGVGKTQLCLSVALVSCQALNQNVIWIDTCGSFHIERLSAMMEEKGIRSEEQDDICRNITTYSVFNANDLLTTLENIRGKLIIQNREAVSCVTKLIVVDSIHAVVGPLLSGYTPDGHGLMMQIGYTLKQLAVDYSLAVLTTNILVGGDSYGVTKPALGRAWASVPHHRLLVTRESVHKVTPWGGDTQPECSTTRTVSIITSKRVMCNRDVQVLITDKGIEDVPS